MALLSVITGEICKCSDRTANRALSQISTKDFLDGTGEKSVSAPG
jgi:hypothetical protein